MEQTPKQFALQIAALITLYVSISAFLILLFGLINLTYPDAAEDYWQIQSSQSGIRYAIAALIVFFPAYLVLTRVVNQARRHASNLYHTLTKWFVYLSILVGGLILLGDLVTVILTYLNGEITVRFILKALALFVVIGLALWYYWLDAKGHWKNHEKTSLQVGGITVVLVIAAVIYGFLNIDSPAVVREIRLDEQQLADLQDMQWRVEAYFQRNETLPASVTEVYEDIAVPVAPENRDDYRYEVTGDKTYELCATFTQPTPGSTELRSVAKPYAEPGYDPNNYVWEHSTGERCFKRTVQLPLK